MMNEALRLHQVQDSTDRALSLLREARRSYRAELPADLEIFYRRALGSIAFDVGQYETAISAFLPAALQVLPADRKDKMIATILIAHACKKLHRTSLALRWYLRAARYASAANAPDIHTNIMTQYYRLGNLDSAVYHGQLAQDAYQRQEAPDPNGSAWRQFIMGSALDRRGDRLSGEQLMRRAIAILSRDKRQRGLSEIRVRDEDLDSMRSIILQYHPRITAKLDMVRSIHAIQRADSLVLDSLYTAPVHAQSIQTRIADLLPPDPMNTGTSFARDVMEDAIVRTVYDTQGFEWAQTFNSWMIIVGSHCFPMPSGAPQLAQEQRRQVALTRRRSWRSAAPDALVHLPATGRALYVRGAMVGYGSLDNEPTSYARIYLPPDVSVRGGLEMENGRVLFGTSKGLFMCDLTRLTCERVQTSPERLMHGVVDVVTRDQQGGIILIDGVIGVFRSTDAHTFRMFTADELPFPMKIPTPASQAFQRLVRSFDPITQDESSSSYSREFAMIGHRAIGASASRIVLYDIDRDRICTRYAPPAVRAALLKGGRMQGWGADTLIVTTADSVFALSVPTSIVDDEDDVRVLVYTPTSDTFKPTEAGASVDVDATSRNVDVIVDGDAEYTGLQIPLSIVRSWNSTPITSTFGTIVRLTDVPPGDHSIRIVVPNRATPLVINVNAHRLWHESWWFIVGTCVLLGTIIVVGIWNYRLRRERRLQAARVRLLEERVSIGHDLHDALGLELVRVARAARTLRSLEGERIVQGVREATRTLRDIIWSVSELEQTVESLTAVLSNRFSALCDESGVVYTFVVDASLSSIHIQPSVARDAMLIMTEAAANSIRHSGSSTLSFEVAGTTNGTTLTIRDQGCGFSIESSTGGTGRVSMNRRSDRSHLQLQLISEPSKGTRVTITIPHTT